MDTELESMLDRADELLGDLEHEYKNCLKLQNVTERAKNLATEVLVKLRSALDHAMRRFWEKNIAPNLHDQKGKRAYVYFPITNELKDFRSLLGQGKMPDLDKNHKKLYDFLLKQQPFSSTENRWLDTLTKIAGEAKHVRLIPQKRMEKINRISVSRPGGAVSWDPSSVRFGAGVSVMSARINPNTQRIVPTPGVIEKVEMLVAFTFDDYGIDALAFCKESCQKTRSLIEEMLNVFS